jgi:hypothetical protein
MQKIIKSYKVTFFYYIMHLPNTCLEHIKNIGENYENTILIFLYNIRNICAFYTYVLILFYLQDKWDISLYIMI